jgi:leucyl aminopeptidase
MKLTVATSFEKRSGKDVLILPFYKGEKGATAAASFEALQAYYRLPVSVQDFMGKNGECLWVYYDSPQEKRMLLLGLGESEKLTVNELRRAYAAAIKAVRSKKQESINLMLPETDFVSADALVAAVVTGSLLANYVFQYKSESKEEESKLVEEICLIGKTASLEEAQKAKCIVEGVYLARDLINGNADTVTPSYLGEMSRALHKQFPRIEVHVHDKKWIEQQNMGLFLAVSRGSATPPQFIVMRYQGNPTSSDHTVLVGKGVTFDTGGLHLKPFGGMEDQRGDMGGAAVVFGTMKACALLELPVNLTCVVASCENAIGPSAYKPGDVYEGMSKKTIEITNTDAEGRLTLADALSYAVEHLKPSRIIDFATLTGSMVIALGSELAGLFSNSESLAVDLFQAGQRTHERVWNFPMYEEYKEPLRSDIADMKNAAGREGGAILAAKFLQEFVGKTPWAHFDIAGVSFLKNAQHYHPKYATGFGVRLMIDYLTHLSGR